VKIQPPRTQILSQKRFTLKLVPCGPRGGARLDLMSKGVTEIERTNPRQRRISMTWAPKRAVLASFLAVGLLTVGAGQSHAGGQSPGGRGGYRGGYGGGNRQGYGDYRQGYGGYRNGYGGYRNGYGGYGGYRNGYGGYGGYGGYRNGYGGYGGYGGYRNGYGGYSGGYNGRGGWYIPPIWGF
jgi:hypothetical protein